MSDAIPYADIVILALIAGFILLRLRNILGQNNPESFKPILPPAPEDHIVQVSEKLKQQKEERAKADAGMEEGLIESSAKPGLDTIRSADPNFSTVSFVEGARLAFEMVFTAFNKGDKPTLAMLMSKDVAQHFEEEIDRRATLENKPETTLVAIESALVTQAEYNAPTARVHVRFISEQVSVVRDKSGAIVEGDPRAITRVEDDWIFERDTNSRNPNWKIIDT